MSSLNSYFIAGAILLSILFISGAANALSATFSDPTPSNNSNLWIDGEKDSFYINVSSDTSAIFVLELSKDGAFYKNFSTGMVYDNLFDLNDLPYGNYSFRVFVSNSSENTVSEVRTIFVDTFKIQLDPNPIFNQTFFKEFNYPINASTTQPAYLMQVIAWKDGGNFGAPASWFYDLLNPKNLTTAFGVIPFSEGMFIINAIGNCSGVNGVMRYSVSGNQTIIIDSTNPNVLFSNETLNDGAVVNQTWITVDVSVDEKYPDNGVFTLSNSSGVVNQTTLTAPKYFINWTNLADGNYSFTVNISDKAGNSNSTPLRSIVLATGYMPIVVPPASVSGRSNRGGGGGGIKTSNVVQQIQIKNESINKTEKENQTLEINDSSPSWAGSSQDIKPVNKSFINTITGAIIGISDNPSVLIGGGLVVALIIIWIIIKLASPTGK